MKEAIELGVNIFKIVGLSTIIVILLFILESAIHAKINEFKQRKIEKKYTEDALNKLVDKIVDNAFAEFDKENDKHE